VTILEYLAYLRSLDIQLEADGDKLRVNAPRGVLTPSLRRELAECEPEIMALRLW